MLKSRTAARACNSTLGLRFSGLGVLLILLASSAEAALTGAGRLAAVYELILSAEFDRVDAELKSTCPPAPPEACRPLDATAWWWRIQIEPDNRSRDTVFNDRARAAVKAADAWTVRDPK